MSEAPGYHDKGSGTIKTQQTRSKDRCFALPGGIGSSRVAPVIERFNRLHVVKAVVAMICSVLALICTVAFFYWGPLFVMYNLGVENRSQYAWGCAALGTLIVLMVGYRRWKGGQGYYGFEDSGIHVQLEPVSGGTFMTQIYAQRITTPAYLFGQLFLAAPMQALKAKQLIAGRVPVEHGLEEPLTLLLEEMQYVGKWQDATVYEDRWTELRYLIHMGKVEYSAKKGRVRAAKDY